jgi:hypothetical protein
LFTIDFKDKDFIILIEEYLERDEFMIIVNFFKRIFIQYVNGDWTIPFKRIDEILMWLDKYKYVYKLSDVAKIKFQEFKKSFKQETTFNRHIEFDSSILNDEVIPYNFQLSAINWRLKRSAYLDAFDAGLGKTFINICVFSQLYKNKQIDGIIIIVPIGLSFHWLRQILEFVKIFKEEDIQVINNEEKIQPFIKFQDKKILIIRQDLIADVIASYKKDYSKKKSLKNLRWETSYFVDIKKEWNKENLLLLIDEAHSIKHLSSIKTKALFSIKKYFKYRLLLTATPSINEFADIYSLISMIDHSIIPYSENAFKIWISQSIGNRWSNYAIIEYNTTNVQKVMKDYSIIFSQARKEEINEVKTKKFIKTIECELTPLQKIIYQKIVEKELLILQEEYDSITWRIIINKIHLLLEIFDNPELLKKRHYNDKEIMQYLNKWKIENDPKFIYLKGKVENICDEQNKKIIIYDIHPLTINLLEEKFKKYNPLIIHGELKVKNKDKDRQEKQDLFNYNKEYRMILLSLYTSSAGINLQHGSNDIIINTLAWDATLFRQAQDRIYRVDSKYDSRIELPYYSLSLDNLRMKKNFDRIELNSRMDKEISREELKNLLGGNIY